MDGTVAEGFEAVSTQNFLDFLLNTQLQDIPDNVLEHGRHCLLDLLGVAAVGEDTELKRTVTRFAERCFPGVGNHQSSVIFDSRVFSPAGAALVGGCTIDAYDCHDGYGGKLHVGCGTLPAILAALSATGGISNEAELLTSLILGYEIGTRLGLGLLILNPEYAASGCFIALSTAAIVGRLFRLDRKKIYEAMGIAEYHGPRCPMMRVVECPSMLKDASGWGSMAGVLSAEMALDGFTGGPPLTLIHKDVIPLFKDIGKRWYILEQTTKPWPICSWAQSATQAVKSLFEEQLFSPSDIENVIIFTYRESKQLKMRHPKTPDEAQYSLPWPVAAMIYALAEGRELGSFDVSSKAIERSDIHDLVDKIIVKEDDACNDAFPSESLSKVEIRFSDGVKRSSALMTFKGHRSRPMTHEDLQKKFDFTISTTKFADDAAKIKIACLQLAKDGQHPSLAPLIFRNEIS